MASNQLSAIDSLFLYADTSRQAMNLSGIGIYDPSTRDGKSINFSDVLDYGHERVRRSALFRRKANVPPFNMDLPYWTEDSNFDAGNHIFHTSLPSPGGRKELDETVARIHAKRISRDGPLWEWWFIDGLTGIDSVPEDAFALLFKLHHAAFDGIAAWEVIDASHDDKPSEYENVLKEKDLPASANRKYEQQKLGDTIVRQGKKWLKAPLDLAALTKDNIPLFQKIRKEGIENFFLHSSKQSKSPFAGTLGQKRHHRKVAMAISDLKRMRFLHDGATINDVVLAVISVALQSYFEKQNLEISGPLNAGVPISVRKPGDEGDAGNQAVMSIISLPHDVADPDAQLAQICSQTSGKKMFVHDVEAGKLTEYLDYVPPSLVSGGLSLAVDMELARLGGGTFNMTITNVPASRTPIYFAGAKMLEYDACGPIWENMGLIHVVTSYLDQVNLSFDVDAGKMADPDLYKTCLENSAKVFLQMARDMQD